MTTELSKDLITHKLIIKGIGDKYITEKFAKNIFNQLASNEKSITITNPETLTFIQKYRSEVTLLPLDEENKGLEFLLYTSGLSESKKDEIRNLIDNRKKDKKSISNTVIKEIIETYKNK